MQLTGKNTRIAGKNTRQMQAKITANAGKKLEKLRAKNLQFHAELLAIAGNLLSHRGYIHLQISGELPCIMQVKLPATYVLY